MSKLLIGAVIFLVIIVVSNVILNRMEKAALAKAIEKENEARARWTPQEKQAHDELQKKAASGARREFLDYAVWLDDHQQYREAKTWYERVTDGVEVVVTDCTDYEGGVAHYRLGLLYRNGYGVERDEKAAIRHFLSSQKSGNDDGTRSVIYAFRNGIGVENSAANRDVADFYERELAKKQGKL